MDSLDVELRRLAVRAGEHDPLQKLNAYDACGHILKFGPSTLQLGLPRLTTVSVADGEAMTIVAARIATWRNRRHAAIDADVIEFPHEEDQFISIAATGWATLALAQVLPAQVSD